MRLADAVMMETVISGAEADMIDKALAQTQLHCTDGADFLADVVLFLKASFVGTLH